MIFAIITMTCNFVLIDISTPLALLPHHDVFIFQAIFSVLLELLALGASSVGLLAEGKATTAAIALGSNG